ncbi:hypothetical protein H5410_041236 [Solanum commersonii]|uniref:Uncharacterized protein n=1 Tax=Solanum commersonii TaxID=4109 RepID=A0A9J5XSG3_SOLCO|nr:hypothetical protein H5410_041236 [Solanum commersonii]
MDRSPRFGSISNDNCPMKTHFRYGSDSDALPSKDDACIGLPQPHFHDLGRSHFAATMGIAFAFFSSATKMFRFAQLSLAAHGFSS